MLDNVMTLIEVIKDDYYRFTSCNGTKELNDVNKRMIADFNESIDYSVGQKYIKITQKKNGSVWGFVVKTDTDKKFKKGDILRAASWSTPARNKPRGNVIDGGYKVQWTGPNYL